MIEILAVVGPTGSGKTGLGVQLAERLDTEIVSADSMQFYRGMAIGTGAPTQEELARAKHHFIGFVEPDASLSAGEFEPMARAKIEGLNGQGKTAIVVGGSGLYIRALVEGLFDGPSKDESIRERLAQEAKTHGAEALYERLQRIDPEYAEVIDKADLRRVVRALEVYELTGQPLSQSHASHRAALSPKPSLLVAIDWPRDELYDRINRRVDQMLTEGLLQEIQTLVDKGYGEHIDRLKSLGYREMAAHLRGEVSLEEATGEMKMNSRRYAKRQLTWWRGDQRLRWLDAHAQEPHVETVLRWLQE